MHSVDGVPRRGYRLTSAGFSVTCRMTDGRRQDIARGRKWIVLVVI